MAQSFKETAHLKTDQKAFEEGWDRIFGKKEEVTCRRCGLPMTKDEIEFLVSNCDKCEREDFEEFHSK